MSFNIDSKGWNPKAHVGVFFCVFFLMFMHISAAFPSGQRKCGLHGPNLHTLVLQKQTLYQLRAEPVSHLQPAESFKALWLISFSFLEMKELFRLKVSLFIKVVINPVLQGPEHLRHEKPQEVKKLLCHLLNKCILQDFPMITRISQSDCSENQV